MLHLPQTGYSAKFKWLLAANIIIILYLLPLLILWDSSYIRIQDNLDSHIIWYKILKNSGKIFSSSMTVMPEIMNAPRFTLYNEFFLLFWLHYFFNTFLAMVINKVIIHFIAFWGMYLLLKNTYKFDLKIVILASLFFSLFPFEAFWGIGVAGQPLLLYALFKIWQKGFNVKYLLIIIVYAFYSNFYSVTAFLLLTIFLFAAFLLIYRIKLGIKVYIALLLLVAISLAMEYRLIYEMFFNHDYVSQRVERLNGSNGFMQCLALSAGCFIHGHFHSLNPYLIFLPIIVWATIYSWYYKTSHLKYFFFFFTLSVLIALLIGFKAYYRLEKLYESISILRTLSFERLYVMWPLVWVVLIFLSMQLILRSRIQLMIGIATIQILVLFYFNSSYQGILKIDTNNDGNISFKDFFAEKLFQSIKSSINYDSKEAKIATLGFPPCIAQYNGFHAIDGYLSNYPLEYKKRFREIMTRELEQNEEIRISFDGWGSKCYLYDNEMSPLAFYTKDKKKDVKLFEIDGAKFTAMGAKYLLSAVKVNEFSCQNIKEIGVFEDITWKIYIYEFK